MLTITSTGLLLLDPAGKGALTDTGNGSVVVNNNGAIVVDSSNSQAAILTGNGNVSAAVIDVTGGTVASGNAHFLGTIKHDAPTPDPLGLPLPAAPSTTFAAVNYSGSAALTLNPGTYLGGIKITGTGPVTLSPGVYYLKGGGFSVSGLGPVTGNGVLVVNAPTKSSDTISFGGQGDVTLTPPASLPAAYTQYAGIAIFQDPASNAAINLIGMGSLTMQGVVYAPKATLNITGTGNMIVNASSTSNARAEVIVFDVNLTGNGGLTVNVPRVPRGNPIIAAALTDDTGVSASDHLTSDPAIGGTVTDVSPIASFRAGFDNTPASSFFDVFANLHADGSFTFGRALLAQINGGLLPDGPHMLHLQASDAAGVTSSFFDVFFTLDTQSPAVAAALANDTGSSASDGLTSDPTVNGSVTDSHAIAALRAGFDGALANSFFDVFANLHADGSFTFGPALLAQINGGQLPDGAHTLHLQASDAAGVTSSFFDVFFTLDTHTPAVAAALTHDTGTSPSDGLTSDPAIGGSIGDTNPITSFRAGFDGAPANSFFDVFANLHADGSFTLSQATMDQIAGGLLPDGPHTLHLQASDAAGNTSSFFDVFFTLDTQSPAIAAALTNDTGTSASDGLTSDPTVNGSVTDTHAIAALRGGFDGAAVNSFFDVFANLHADGTFTLSQATMAQIAGGLLPDGPHTLHLQASDAAGNTSGFFDVFFTLDMQPPVDPQFDLSAGSASPAAATPGMTDAARVTLLGTTSPNVTVKLLETGAMTLSSNTGFFQFPDVTVALGDNTFTAQATDAAGNTSSFQRVIHRTPNPGQQDPVLRWVQAAINAIQFDATTPPMASRALAMVSAAVYDAVSSIEGKPGYYVTMASPAGASVQAAVSGAADEVLDYLYPAQKSMLDSVLAAALSQITNNQSESDGLAVGRQVGDAIIALRSNDGWNKYVDYVHGSQPGDWLPTAPMYAPALLPQWATLTPFAMTSDNQFLPAGPPDLTSQQWADAFNEVKSVGTANSTTRTADQTQIARFWADGGGTYTPPGHWDQIAAQIAAQQSSSLDENARLFAELNVALGDAAIVAWNTKYDYNTWRPITAIQNADQAGNPNVQADPNWTPLLTTPPFPEYISGHSTFSGAAASVLDALFGQNFAFSSTSAFLKDASGNPVTRSFSSVDAAANEAGQSRIYGGIHFQFSNQDGLAAGHALANYVLGTFSVSTDSQPPKIVIDNPDGQAANHNITLTGHVLDNLSGVASLLVQVDQGSFVAVNFNNQGQFSVPTQFALDDSADGLHTLTFQATDAAGNTTSPLVFHFTLATLAPALVISSPTDNDNLSIGALLTGTIDGHGVPIVALNYAFDGGMPMPIDPSAGSFSVPLDLSHLALGSHPLTVSAEDAAGNTATTTLAVNLPQSLPLSLTSFTPDNGAGDVGVTYRPKITFSRPIDATTLNSNSFFATDTTGAKLAATIVPADDGSYAWLFFGQPLPGASKIAVTVDGSTIHTLDGTPLDAASNGTPGSLLHYSFTTVSLSALPNTSITGIVADPGPDLKPGTVDDVKPGPDGVLMTADDVYLNPIAGVKVFIVGMESQAVFSDARGNFSFPSVPVGNVKLAIDGRTATNAPAGVFFPEMVMDLNLQPGQVNAVMASMTTDPVRSAASTELGVYLPRLQTSILQPVSNSEPTVIGVDSQSAPDLTPEQREHLSITVQPGSARGMDGQPLANPQIGISTVPPELVRDMLPPGLMQLSATLTIQAPGVATFAQPVALSFPNIYGAAPGTKLPFYSFDHTTGRLVISGTATVSQDGTFAVTDPDNGITFPGWYGVTPPGSNSSPTNPTQQETVEVNGGFLGDIIQVDLQFELPNLQDFTFQKPGQGLGAIAQYPGWQDDLLNQGTFYFVPNADSSNPQSTDTVQLFFAATDQTNNKQVQILVEFKSLSAGDVFRRGYSSFQLLGSVGAGRDNYPLDIYRVQQRLKFLGFRAQGGNRLAVDGVWGPATQSSLRLFQAVVDSTGQANPLNMTGLIDRGDDTLAWLIASNAPRWVQLPVASFGFNTKDGAAQPERWGTDWSIHTTESAGAATVGHTLTINGISTVDGYGSSAFHQEHQAGMDIDVHIEPTGREPGNLSEQNILLSHGVNVPIVAGPLTAGETQVVEDMLSFWRGAGDGARVWRILVTYQRIVDEFNRRINLERPGVGNVAQVDHAVTTPHWNHFHVDLDPPAVGDSQPESDVIVTVVPPDPGFGSDPRLYYRFQLSNGFEIAGRSNTLGQFSLLLPPNMGYTATYYQASTNQAGVYHGHTNASGTTTNLGTIVLDQFGGHDSDGDGLPDIGEFAIGTNPNLYSTTGDGISDGAKIAAGLDPLGGKAFPTGVIAGLSLSGQAKEVVLEGSTLDPKGQTAYVATGSYGLAIVDASQFQKPVVLGQIDLPGDASDAAVDSNLKIAAVATNAGGLQLVNVANPAAPVLLQTIDAQASQVEIVDGIAYASVGGELRAYDLLTGNELQRLALSGSNVTGMAREGSFLYTMDSSRTLRAIDISSFLMVARGSLNIPAGGGKLFVGGGIAYASSGRGFATVNVVNPNGLALISGVDATNIAGQSVVVNGSGVGIGVGSLPGLGNLLHVLNVTDPTNTAGFITQFALPASPFSVAIGAGIAFVADGTSGLQVVNYLPFDNRGQAPTVDATTSATDLDPSTPELQVLEGSTILVRADVRDDVQVRNVELLVNGRVVRNEVSFPFNLSLVVPGITATSNTATIQVRATDTGGNTSFSNVLTIGLLNDATPPTITSVVPLNNSTQLEPLQTVQVRFSEAMAGDSVTSSTIRVRDAAGAYLTPSNFQLRYDDRTANFTFTGLAAGNYELVISATLMTDRAGNPLGEADIISSFTLTPRATLATTVADVDPGTPGVQVNEGTTIPITVNVVAGVAVQNVALLVNGQLVATDAATPFQFSVVAPNITPDTDTITLQALITDTKGISTPASIIIGLREDVTPPSIISINPLAGASRAEGSQSVSIQFSEPMAAATVSNVRVRDSLGNLTSPSSFQLSNDDRLVQLSFQALATGSYELVIKAASVTDRSGNPLGVSDIISPFTLTPRDTLDATVVDADSGMPGLQVFEGTTIPITVNVFPGVAVQSVDLLVNGQPVATDFADPFEFSVIAPNITPESNSITLQARVTETGGFIASTNVIVIGLLENVTPPSIVRIDPSDGATRFEGQKTFVIWFSEPLAVASAAEENFQLFEAGPGGVFGDGNDVPVAITAVQLLTANTGIQLTTPPLLEGVYQIRIHREGITDLAGNPLGTGTFSSSFDVHGHGRLLVGDSATDSVIVIDAFTNAVVGVVPIPGDLFDVAITEDGSLGFASDVLNNRVWVIDMASPTPHLELGYWFNFVSGSSVGHIAITPDQRFLVVSSGPSAAAESFQGYVVFDFAARSFVTSHGFSGSGIIDSMEVVPDGSILVASSSDSGVVWHSGAQGAFLGFKNFGFPIYNIFADPDGIFGIAVGGAVGAGRMSSFTMPGLRPVESRPLPGIGVSGLINPTGDRVYVYEDDSSPEGGRIDVFSFDSITGIVGALPLFSIPIAIAPPTPGVDQMAISSDGTQLYVSQPRALNVYDALTGSLSISITDTTIQSPAGVAMSGNLSLPRLLATLGTTVNDSNIATPGLQVFEGTTIPISVNVFPGVAVQNVDLLVNGQVVATDAATPFQFSVIAPNITPESNSITLQARVRGTGGFIASTNVIVIGLLEDVVPPRINFVDEANWASLGKIGVWFSESMASATITTNSFRLRDSLGNLTSPSSFQLSNDDRLVQFSFQALATGSYELVINAASMTDRVGNPLGVTDIIVPTSTLVTTVVDVVPGMPGLQVFEGTTIPITVNVLPGAAVQYVQLSGFNPLDFNVTQFDFAAPFQFSVIAPNFTQQRITLQAYVETTSGITVGTNAIEIELVEDFTLRGFGLALEGIPGGVLIVDLSSGQLLNTVPLPGFFGDVVIMADGTIGFASDSSSNNVWVIDLASPTPGLAAGINPIPIANLGGDMAITPDQRFLLVAGNGSTGAPQGLSVINIASRSLMGTFFPGYNVQSVDALPDGSILVGSSDSGGIVARLTISSTGTVSVAGTLSFANDFGVPLDSLNNVFASADGQFGFAIGNSLDFGPIMLSFTLPDLFPSDLIPLSGLPVSGLINPPFDLIYVRENDPSLPFGLIEVFFFDSSTGGFGPPLFPIMVPGALPFPSAAGVDAMAISLDGTKLYVSTELGLNVYDALSGALLATIAAPGGFGVAVSG